MQVRDGEELLKKYKTEIQRCHFGGKRSSRNVSFTLAKRMFALNNVKKIRRL